MVAPADIIALFKDLLTVLAGYATVGDDASAESVAQLQTYYEFINKGWFVNDI
jgi:hypothetical protein